MDVILDRKITIAIRQWRKKGNYSSTNQTIINNEKLCSPTKLIQTSKIKVNGRKC